LDEIQGAEKVTTEAYSSYAGVGTEAPQRRSSPNGWVLKERRKSGSQESPFSSA